jgi:hypothetical protein
MEVLPFGFFHDPDGISGFFQLLQWACRLLAANLALNGQETPAGSGRNFCQVTLSAPIRKRNMQ